MKALFLLALFAFAEHQPKKALPIPKKGVIKQGKISSNKGGQQVTLLPGGFCEDPYTILCLAGEVTTRRERVDIQTLQASQATVNQSIEKVKKKYLKARVVLKDKDVFSSAYYPDYLNFLYEALYQQVESPKFLNEIKTVVPKTIEDEPESVSLPRDRKNDLTTQAKEVGYVYQANELVALDKEFPRENLLQVYREKCREDGMGRNAFFNQASKKVILCPGLILRSVAEDPPIGGGPALCDNRYLLAVGVHELAHTFRGNGMYDRIDACWKDMEEGSDLKPEQLSELHADYWAFAAAAQRLKTVEDPKVIIGFLRGVADPFCATGGDANHASARTRINLTAGHNEVLRRKLGCPAPSADNALCHLSGKSIVPIRPGKVYNNQ